MALGREQVSFQKGEVAEMQIKAKKACAWTPIITIKLSEVRSHSIMSLI